MPRKKSGDTRKRQNKLREQAEKLLPAKLSGTGQLTTEDMQRLVHELQIHQIELELQNEELRHAQAELAESRDRYSDLYEFAPIGYVTLDRDDKILEANLTSASMLGVERGTLLRCKFSKFVGRESQNEWYRHRQAVSSSDAAQTCEIGMRRASGKPLVVRVESNAFGPEDSRRCRTAFIDNTRRKEAEQAVEEATLALERRVDEQTAKIRLQAKAIASLGEGVVITEGHLHRPDSRIVFVNEAICRMTGYAAEELIGKTPSILHGPETERETLTYIRKRLSEGKSAHAELVCYRKDRTVYDLDLFITPLRDDGGRPSNFVSIHRDITDRKKADRALRESEQRMRAILNAAADAIITTDRTGTILSANAATERMFGYSSEELAGQHIELLIPPAHRQSYGSHLSHYLVTLQANAAGGVQEAAGLRKDGSRFPVDLAVSDVETFGLFTLILRDISARKEAEHELRQYRNHLRAMSTELILAEDRERQKLAQDLHDGLGQAIFLARRKLDRASIDEAGTILDDMGRMVNALTFELSPPVLRQLGFKSAVQWLAKDMKQRYGLSVQVDVDEQQTLPLDESVALALFRSVRELLINIARHAQTDSANMSVRRKKQSIEISVQDRGKGFDPVKQSGTATPRHFGLFSARERLEYLGGTLDVKSVPGKGTRVTLSAPLSSHR